MEKEKNIILMANYCLKENIYIIRKGKERHMQMILWNIKGNIYLIKNGME